MNIGIIKWYNSEGNYGVISTLMKSHDKAIDVFLHSSNWKVSLSENTLTPIVIETFIDVSKKRLSAMKCRFFDYSSQEDWTELLHYERQGNKVNKERDHKEVSYSILECCLKSLKDPCDLTLLGKFYSEKLNNSEIKSQKDISWLLNAKNISSNKSFQILIDELVTTLPFDIRKVLLFATSYSFENVISLRNFSVEECLDMVEDITFNDIKVLCPEQDGKAYSIIHKIILSFSHPYNDNEISFIESYINLLSDENFKNILIREVGKHLEENLSKYEDQIITYVDKKSWHDIDRILRPLSFINENCKIQIKKYLSKNIYGRCDLKDVIVTTARGFIENGENYIRQHSDLLDIECVNKLCNNCNSFSQELVYDMVASYFSKTHDYINIQKLVNGLKEEIKGKLTDLVKFNITGDEYVLLWSKQLCEEMPDYISLTSYFDDKEEKYEEADRWIKQAKIVPSTLFKIIYDVLNKSIKGNSRKEFCTSIYAIEFLQRNNQSFQYEISPVLPILYKIIAWLQDGKGEFDFALIKENFSFFPSKYQVRILKILFRLKVNKLLDFGADEIVSFAEITEEKKSKGGCVCLSVIIVLNSIKSYLHNHKFLLERDMFNLAFSNIGKNFKEWLSVSDFFDICEGKKYYSFPQNCSRCIFPILDKSGRRWYIIKFPFNENLISIVKQIPGRCYHPKFCVWFIPGEQKQSAINLAQRNSFWFISKDMPIYCIGQDINKILHNCNINDIKSDNIHLATLKMSDEKMPEPYFCDGRESQKEGYRNTWWCLGHKPCSACCVHLHDANSWEKYTLLDFLHILGIDLEEYSGTSDFVYGNYLKFVSLIDRFNMLLSRLYCHECGELLYPTNSTYAYYSVTRFHCENENCSQYDEDIYLNHCLNSHCKSIIDSRESSTCTNGLYICPKCGTCCSNVMFNGQIERLKKAGGYISQDLKEKTENKLGHLEKKEYFCYHCGEPIKAEIRTLTERFGMLDTDCSKCHKHIHYVVWLNNYKSGLDKR